MAQQYYKVSLQDPAFPMLSEQQSRTVMGSEQGKAPAAENRPSLAYCHNVMPTAQGLDSVGYLSVIPLYPNLPAGATFHDVRIAYGSEKSRLYLAWDTLGHVYVLLTGSSRWLPIADIAGGPYAPATTTVTIGTVNGVSYIFYEKLGAYTFEESTNTFAPVLLAGLSISDILGVVASSGYLVAYTEDAIAWSSTILPTDFVPSPATGAGGGSVAGIAGSILFATPSSLGLLISTAANTISATYTGNAQFPFKFREVEDSKGGINLDLVAYEANSKAQIIYSKAGAQSITSQRAEIIAPEVTDFVAGRRFEDYNETTREYEVTDLADGATMLKKIKSVASRYLILSYGLTSFTHAIVYDVALKRLGKLKIPHVDCFEYVGAQTEISKETLAFLAADGEVKVVDFSATATSVGVVILGKLQQTRSKLVTLLEVEVENVDLDASLDIYSQASLAGKGFTSVQGSLISSEENLRKYAFRTTALNHSLVFIGQFNLVTAQVMYKLAGRR